MRLTKDWEEGWPLHTTELVYLHDSVAPVQPAMMHSSLPALMLNFLPSKAVFLNILCYEASPVSPGSWSSMCLRGWREGCKGRVGKPSLLLLVQTATWVALNLFHFLFSIYATYDVTLGWYHLYICNMDLKNILFTSVTLISVFTLS